MADLISPTGEIRPSSPETQSSYSDTFPTPLPQAPERSEPLNRYIASQTQIQPSITTSSPYSSPSPVTSYPYPYPYPSHSHLTILPENNESDSETAVKIDEFRATLNKAKRLFSEQNYPLAKTRFMSCLRSIQEAQVDGSLSHRQMVLFRPEIIRCLLSIYRIEQRWDEALSLVMDFIRAEATLVVDMMALAGTLYQNKSFDQALACGMRALRVYNKTGQVGSVEERETLQLLIEICKAQGNQDKKTKYEDLLEERERRPPPQSSRSRRSIASSSSPSDSPTLGYRDLGDLGDSNTPQNQRNPPLQLSPGTGSADSDSQTLASSRDSGDPTAHQNQRNPSLHLSPGTGSTYSDSQTLTHSRESGDPTTTHIQRNPSLHLNPNSAESENTSQRLTSPSPKIWTPSPKPINRISNGDPTSPYSPATPELSHSVRDTPRSSVATTMDVRNGQYRRGYLDAEPRSGTWSGHARDSTSTGGLRYTFCMSEQESDEVVHDTTQKHKSLDSTKLPFVANVYEVRDQPQLGNAPSGRARDSTGGPRYTAYSVSRPESDEAGSETTQKNTSSLDSTKSPFVTNVYEVRDPRDRDTDHEVVPFPVPPRSNLRPEQEIRDEVVATGIPPRSNSRPGQYTGNERLAVPPPQSNFRIHDQESLDVVAPLRPRRAVVSDLEFDNTITPRPTTVVESVTSNDYGSEKEAYFPNNEKHEEKTALPRSPTRSTTPSIQPDHSRSASISSRSSGPPARGAYKKIVVVGDSGSGKTPLISRFVRNMYSEHNPETTYNVNSMDITVQGCRLELVIWEIGGHDKEGLNRLRSSPKTDVFLICFAIDSPSALKMIPLVWMKDVKKYGKSASYILLGLKSDSRSDPATIENLRQKGEQPVSIEQGQSMADQIQAARYMECSAKTGEGIREVFEKVTNMTINSNDLVKAMKEKDRGKKGRGEEKKSSTGFIKELWRKGI